MAMDIRQGLLHQPKNGRLQIARQPIEIVRELQLNRDLAAFCKSLDVHPESGSKPRFIKQRRVEEVGNRADILGHIVHQGRAIRDRARRLGETFEVRSQAGQVHVECREGLSDAIVQFACDAPALFILQMKLPAGGRRSYQ